MGDDIDYSDLGFPQATAADLARNPYDEDGYCEFCGNGAWKLHAPWCTWQDLIDAAREYAAEIGVEYEAMLPTDRRPVPGDQP